MSPRWYVVNTHPHQEGRADLNLRRQGFMSWLPQLRRSRRHARRIETVSAPMFPGYIFVQIDPDAQAWRSINGTFGVRNLICQDEKPVALPQGFVEGLRETLDGEGLVALPLESFHIGDQVKLLAGPFVDCVGKLVALADRDRVALLLHVLGRDVHTVVSRRAIASVA